MILVATATGAIGGFICAAIIWPDIYPLAYAATVTVGSLTGLALGILTNIVRGR
jgi:hypothetical protein